MGLGSQIEPPKIQYYEKVRERDGGRYIDITQRVSNDL